MATKKPRNRSPRNALLFVREVARAALDNAENLTHGQLVAAMIRVERLALDGDQGYPCGHLCRECRTKIEETKGARPC